MEKLRLENIHLAVSQELKIDISDVRKSFSPLVLCNREFSRSLDTGINHYLVSQSEAGFALLRAFIAIEGISRVIKDEDLAYLATKPYNEIFSYLQHATI